MVTLPLVSEAGRIFHQYSPKSEVNQNDFCRRWIQGQKSGKREGGRGHTKACLGYAVFYLPFLNNGRFALFRTMRRSVNVWTSYSSFQCHLIITSWRNWCEMLIPEHYNDTYKVLCLILSMSTLLFSERFPKIFVTVCFHVAGSLPGRSAKFSCSPPPPILQPTSQLRSQNSVRKWVVKT